MTAKLTVNLPDGLRKRARAIAALRGETVSDVVRAALEEYVERAGAPQEGSYLKEDDAIYQIVGIGKGGPADLSDDKYKYFDEALD